MKGLMFFLWMLLEVFPLQEGPLGIRCTYVIIAYMLLFISPFVLLEIMDVYYAEYIIEKIKVPGIVFFFLFNIMTFFITGLGGLVTKTNLNNMIKYNIAYFLYCVAVIPAEISSIKMLAEDFEDQKRGMGGNSSARSKMMIIYCLILPMVILWLGSGFPEHNVISNFIAMGKAPESYIFFLWVAVEVIFEIRRIRWKKKNKK